MNSNELKKLKDERSFAARMWGTQSDEYHKAVLKYCIEQKKENEIEQKQYFENREKEKELEYKKIESMDTENLLIYIAKSLFKK